MENSHDESEIKPLNNNTDSSEEVNSNEQLTEGASQQEGLPDQQLQRISNRVFQEGKMPLSMVETAFLASTASLIWLINYYFPLGPLLRIFFPIPIALVYLRWGHRASWMSALVSGLLLSVLMGPTRSILFFIPYGLMGVQLGALWRGGSNWLLSIGIGGLIGTLGFFFRFWLLSILLGEDLWVYLMTQIIEIAEWVFVKLGFLAQPNLLLVQALALAMVILNNMIYLFVVHLVALLLLDRLGNPIPRPPRWVQVLVDYDY